MYYTRIDIQIWLEEERMVAILQEEVLSVRGVPGTDIMLRMYLGVVQLSRKIICRLPKGKAVQVGMKNGLPKNAMFPEDGRGVELSQKVLYFVLKCQKLFVQVGRYSAIAGIVVPGDNKQMTFYKWCVIGNNAKCRRLFEYIWGDTAVLTECTVGFCCFGI
jgi:hypothetical protein